MAFMAKPDLRWGVFNSAGELTHAIGVSRDHAIECWMAKYPAGASWDRCEAEGYVAAEFEIWPVGQPREVKAA